MTATPKVSVIMNCLNCEKYLREAIDSVYAQTYKDWEIIFWDNQSTDNSAAIARKYDRKLKYFFGRSFLSLGAARNAAIQKASGKYIAFLDCDDLWLPEKLEKQIDYLESHKDIALIYSDCYDIIKGEILKNNTVFETVKPFKGDVFEELLCNNFISFLTVVVRKTALDKVGMFDPKYNIVEDHDLYLRLAEHYSFDFLDQPLAVYRIHDENASKNREVAVAEILRLMKYWLNRKPILKKRLGNKIKQREVELRFNLICYYFNTHRTQKLINECFNLLKLFPYIYLKF